MLLDGAFTALLLLVTGVSAGIVLPPTKVTVSCQNSNITASWEYSKQQPQARFRLNIGDLEDETTDHQFDLSQYVWATEERYLDVHYVTVTALQGGQQSEPVQSKTFSFNELKTFHTQCVMHFPPVDLNLQHSGATVSFRNPFHFYRDLEQAVKPDSATFKFTVSSGGEEDFEGVCSVNQQNCKLDVSFPEAAETCVTLRGRLVAGNGIGQIIFNETGRVCPGSSAEVHVMLLILLLSIVVVVVIVVTVVICVTKAWSMKEVYMDQPEPQALKPSNHSGSRYYTVSTTDISAVRVVVNKPCRSPSVSSRDDSLQDDANSYFRYPDNFYTEGGLSESSNQELKALGLIAEGHKTDDDSAEDSLKTECVSMDLEEEEEEEEVVSPYDCPQTLHMDLGDGDLVTAYSRR